MSASYLEEEVIESARRHIRSWQPGTLIGSELNLACALRDLDGETWEPWCVPGEAEPDLEYKLAADVIKAARELKFGAYPAHGVGFVTILTKGSFADLGDAIARYDALKG